LPKKNKVTNNEISSVEINEKIAIKPIDYYYSNAIARSSKTMSDCKNTMNNNKKNGTNN
jgi:NADH-quinone oxidoreductase subunit G